MPETYRVWKRGHEGASTIYLGEFPEGKLNQIHGKANLADWQSLHVEIVPSPVLLSADFRMGRRLNIQSVHFAIGDDDGFFLHGSDFVGITLTRASDSDERLYDAKLLADAPGFRMMAATMDDQLTYMLLPAGENCEYVILEPWKDDMIALAHELKGARSLTNEN